MKTQALVYDLLDKLAQEDKEIPSLRKIRDEIGRGSLSTIGDAVNNWKAARGFSDAEIEALPTILTDDVGAKLVETIWTALRPIMTQRMEAQRKAHTAEIQALQEKLQSATQSATDFEAHSRELEHELAQLKAELKDAQLARAKAEGALEAFKSMK